MNQFELVVKVNEWSNLFTSMKVVDILMPRDQKNYRITVKDRFILHRPHMCIPYGFELRLVRCSHILVVICLDGFGSIQCANIRSALGIFYRVCHSAGYISVGNGVDQR
jgi:hypothetical protein